MARLHWECANTFVHPGGAGFNALGFNPKINPDQMSLEFNFGWDARQDSLNAAIEQLPRLVYDYANIGGEPIALRELFRARCNETPLTLELTSEAASHLRDELKEVEVLSPNGILRPRALKLSPDDRIRLRRQGSFLRQLATGHSKP